MSYPQSATEFSALTQEWRLDGGTTSLSDDVGVRVNILTFGVDFRAALLEA